MSMLAAVDAPAVTAIAAEIFASMIDRESGLVTSWSGGPPTVSDPVYAWIELSTAPVSRLQLTTDAGTADELTRAFLAIGSAGPVSEADLADALGEITNVLGGNVKALLTEHVELSLPEVSRQRPSRDGAAGRQEIPLAWRGRPLVISLYTI
jgi:chemotaxis protein CheX